MWKKMWVPDQTAARKVSIDPAGKIVVEDEIAVDIIYVLGCSCSVCDERWFLDQQANLAAIFKNLP